MKKQINNKPAKVVNKVNTHDSWDESRVEFVSRDDEQETLQTMGLSWQHGKSVYNKGFDTYSE